MHITDPVADMLTRVRNANNAKHETVDVPASNMKKSIAQILLDEGYMIAPGAMFHASRGSSTCMRINFAATQDASFWQAFARERVALLR